mgnify:CR=1 FL=1
MKPNRPFLKPSFFSLVIVPPSGRSWTCRLSQNTLLVAVFCLLLFFSIGGWLFFQGGLRGLSQDYRQLRHETVEQQKQIQDLEEEIKDVQRHIEDLIERKEELRSILGNRFFEQSYGPALAQAQIQIRRLETELRAIDLVAETDIDGAFNRLSLLKAHLADLNLQFLTLSQKAEGYRMRFAATPSIWPLYGQILSDFGFRSHPLSHNFQFHKGVDIPSWTGAPVRATGDGICVMSGWNGGYGLCAVLDHGNGIKTIYGHCSKVLIKVGDVVKKGQKIANVGSSGLSTGPHLHYEIRRWDAAISPREYLNLDLYTASTRVW